MRNLVISLQNSDTQVTPIQTIEAIKKAVSKCFHSMV